MKKETFPQRGSFKKYFFPKSPIFNIYLKKKLFYFGKSTNNICDKMGTGFKSCQVPDINKKELDLCAV